MVNNAKKHLLHSLKDVENTPIGQGGMATIFKTQQQSLGRSVVIKRIKEELKHHPTVLKRFEREAKASAKLLHQNLSHVYDYVTDDASPYIVMEYIDGVDVADILARRGYTPVEVALAIMYGVTRGLAYIHSHGLVHRDIKPENIRVSKFGDVKLMDFGIALKQAEESKLTLPGIIIGSPHYLSPEQILGESIGPRSDLFSLGITLYELLTGSRPFDSATQETVFYNIRKGIYKPATKLNSKIPHRVNQMVKKLLQPKQERRYQSAWEVHREIRDILDLEDERPYLRQYLIYESFAEPGPHEAVKPPRLPHKRWFKKFAKNVFTISLFAAVGWLGGGNIKNIPNLSGGFKTAPSFCIGSVEDTNYYTPAARKRILQIIYEEGYPIAGFPELLKIKNKLYPRYRSIFSAIDRREQKIILEINKAKDIDALFSSKRKSIAWPKRPPCEKF